MIEEHIDSTFEHDYVIDGKTLIALMESRLASLEREVGVLRDRIAELEEGAEGPDLEAFRKLDDAGKIAFLRGLPPQEREAYKGTGFAHWHEVTHEPVRPSPPLIVKTGISGQD